MREITAMAQAGALSLAGCSSEGGDGGTSSTEEPCAFSTQISGAEQATIDWSGLGYCGSARGNTDLMSLLFGYGSTTNTTDLGATVLISLPSATETGTKPVVLEIGKSCGILGNDCTDSWTTPDGACSLDITKHEFHHSTSIFDHYLLEGTGTCTAPATSMSGTELTIAPFSLAIAHLWDKGG